MSLRVQGITVKRCTFSDCCGALLSTSSLHEQVVDEVVFPRFHGICAY